MIQLNIPRSEVKRFENELKRYAKRNNKEVSFQLQNATLTAERLAKKKAPIGPPGKGPRGNLKRHIRSEMASTGMTGAVLSGARYSSAVEYGTKPHIIRAKNKKVLANVNTGQFFGKKVRHPGTDAHPFLAPALKFGYKKLIENLEKVFK